MKRLSHRLAVALVAVLLPLSAVACDDAAEDSEPVVEDQEGGATTDTGVTDDLDAETSS